MQYKLPDHPLLRLGKPLIISTNTPSPALPDQHGLSAQTIVLIEGDRVGNETTFNTVVMFSPTTSTTVMTSREEPVRPQPAHKSKICLAT